MVFYLIVNSALEIDVNQKSKIIVNVIVFLGKLKLTLKSLFSSWSSYEIKTFF